MVHTAELTTQLTIDEFRKIEHHPNTRQYEKDGKHIIENILLSQYGISHVYIFRSPISNATNIQDDFNYSYWCKVQVNLLRVASGGKKVIGVFRDPELLETLHINFREYMKELLPIKCELSQWSTTRIDYAVDIKTPFVKEYIKLFQKGDKPHGMEIPDAGQKRRAEKRSHPYKTSVRYQDKSKTINFYDKHAERLQDQERRGFADDVELEGYGETIRFEVQCKRNKTNALRFKLKMDSKELSNFLCIPEAKEIILKTYKKVCGTGNYYRFIDAKKAIRISNKQERTKDKMCDVLSLINGGTGTRSIWKARDKYEGNFEAIVKHFEGLGVNMVTIPETMQIEKDQVPLKSLYNDIELELN